ncbi:YbfB/YjiJ family MFS transporter [Arthrobacter sp. efr-133-R2A-120]|uniref:YbfB/YjiJ family MFS transporter n=1 Tax=Arthrobacter sp. efr-133-R2A-120 TaxID=3040277 RepID=UPI00254C0F96|nr:YbfB/YjiJ family MFS transporter [Arthrobacter sp. efr-133-R2A-120]
MSAAVTSPMRAWCHVGQAAAALAGGMGVGRFVYTPILPAMHAQAGLSTVAGAHLATANYVGYLAGALAGIAFPAVSRSRATLRGSFAVLIASLAAMPATESEFVWMVLRGLAGVTSALIFVFAVSALLSGLRESHAHLAGWGFGGVGAGIAASGLLVLVLLPITDWRAAWWASAALTAVLAAIGWTLRTAPGDPTPAVGAKLRPVWPGAPGRFAALLISYTSYTLEGAGYIVAGTFLVAAIEQKATGGLGCSAWVLAGAAAVPASALWMRLGRRWSRLHLLLAALVLQGVGIALPALTDGVGADLASAALFGGTFVGISALALAVGNELRFPRSVGLLTAGYSVGQIVGPLVVAPILQQGYGPALLTAGAIVLAAAVTAAGVGRVPARQFSTPAVPLSEK